MSKKILIIPGDVFNPGGSMGDLAMLSGLVSLLVRNHHLNSIDDCAVVSSKTGLVDIPIHGQVDEIPAWTGVWGFLRYLSLLLFAKHVYVIGADVLDGRYSSHIVRKTVVFANLAAFLKLKVVFVGFSFNSRPTPMSVKWLRHINPQAFLNIRDKKSLSRFRDVIGSPAKLVADVAFLMLVDKELPDSQGVKGWIEFQKNKGKVVVGVNINAHAFKDSVLKFGVDFIVDRVAAELLRVVSVARVSYLLIPHDFKDASGDFDFLTRLKQRIGSVAGADLDLFLLEIENPALIKSVVSAVDFVVTGRMHLAIAAFGVGVLSVSIDYQDKFLGLYEHFQLGDEFLIHPDHVMLEGRLFEKIQYALGVYGEIGLGIQSRLDEVLKLAASNDVD